MCFRALSFLVLRAKDVQGLAFYLSDTLKCPKRFGTLFEKFLNYLFLNITFLFLLLSLTALYAIILSYFKQTYSSPFW